MRAPPLRGQEGGGPGNRYFFGPCEMAAVMRVPFRAQKKSRFPGPNPIPLAQVMDLPASEALRTGPLR